VLRGQRLAQVDIGRTAGPERKVLVVDGGGSLRSALVGDLIAGIAVRRGWAGLVISGAVRDSVALDQLDLGIKALGTNPQKSSKTGTGFVNGPVEIGGVWVTPGQTVHSDEDGIVVVGSGDQLRGQVRRVDVHHHPAKLQPLDHDREGRR
jgi:RraA family protein